MRIKENELLTLKQVANELDISVSAVMLYIKRNNLNKLLTCNDKNILCFTPKSYNEFIKHRQANDKIKGCNVDNISNESNTTENITSNETYNTTSYTVEITQLKELYNIILEEKDKQINLLQAEVEKKDQTINNLINNNAEQLKAEQLKLLSITNQIISLQEEKQRDQEEKTNKKGLFGFLFR